MLRTAKAANQPSERHTYVIVLACVDVYLKDKRRCVQLRVTKPDVQTIALTAIDVPQKQAKRSRWAKGGSARRKTTSWVWFVMLVWVPTAAAVAYFGWYAADRFEAESRFIVRSPSSAAASQITSLVQGSGIVRSADDAYVVHAYIRSRDALRKLVTESELLQRLDRPEADILWRYPGLFFAHTDERLWKHFKDFVTIDFDSTTGISTLSVQAFRPEDAHAIADALLLDAEMLINRLSERAQGDAIKTATREVDQSRERARDALNRITDFRRKHEMIDPGRVSTAALETITRLALEIAQTNAQLSELKQASPNSPQTATLRLRIAAYEEQIVRERAALAGTDTSLAPLIAEYERLVLEREFAERTFASAQTALDIARVDAQRQRLFLERISTPGIPDYPKYPKRILSILATFGLCYMLYSIGRRLVADTRAHAGH
jgi:capsular polysaccharide transport system permease protein